MGPVIKKYCCRKELCDHAPVSEVDSKPHLKLIGFRLGKRHCNEREFKQERASCLNQLKIFQLQLIHDIIEVFAKLKTKCLILYQSTILMWITFLDALASLDFTLVSKPVSK